MQALTNHSSTCSRKSLATDQETWPKKSRFSSTVRRLKENNLVQQERCIHICVQVSPRQAQWPEITSQPSGRLTCSTPELGAQFEPHQRNQKEVTTPVKHVLLPDHVKMAAGSLLSSSEKADCCRGFQLCNQRKRKEAQYSGQLFNQTTSTR